MARALAPPAQKCRWHPSNLRGVLTRPSARSQRVAVATLPELLWPSLNGLASPASTSMRSETTGTSDLTTVEPAPFQPGLALGGGIQRQPLCRGQVFVFEMVESIRRLV